MEQIRVKKTETAQNGEVTERIMTMPRPTWERKLKEVPHKGVKWERLGSSNDSTEKELIPAKIGTDHLAKKEEIAATVESDVVDYSNYTIQELRDACRNADIKFANSEKEPTLIKKLQAHDKGASNK